MSEPSVKTGNSLCMVFELLFRLYLGCRVFYAESGPATFFVVSTSQMIFRNITNSMAES